MSQLFDQILEHSSRTMRKLLGREPDIVEVAPAVMGETVAHLGVLRERGDFGTFNELLDDALAFQSAGRRSMPAEEFRRIFAAGVEAGNDMDAGVPIGNLEEPASSSSSALTPEELLELGLGDVDEGGPLHLEMGPVYGPGDEVHIPATIVASSHEEFEELRARFQQSEAPHCAGEAAGEASGGAERKSGKPPAPDLAVTEKASGCKSAESGEHQAS